MNEAKKPARVLVVDDDARNSRLAVTALEQAGRPAREVILVHDFVPNLK